MPETNRVVLGDDGSPAADVAWLWLNTHVWSDWEVAVVHAETPDMTRLPFDAADTEVHQWQPPHPRHAFAEARFADVSHLTALGDPRIVLSSLTDVDLMVIGPRGPGLLKAVHLGSTAEWLLVRPPSPLLVVKSARPVRSVLACVDGSSHAWRAVRTLAALPWVSDTSVLVLGAEDGRPEVRAAVPVAAAELRSVAGEVSVRLASGPATTAIHDVLDRTDVDLVVLGTRGHTGLKHLALGSTASHVARAAHCSVMVAADQPIPD